MIYMCLIRFWTQNIFYRNFFISRPVNRFEMNCHLIFKQPPWKGPYSDCYLCIRISQRCVRILNTTHQVALPWSCRPAERGPLAGSWCCWQSGPAPRSCRTGPTRSAERWIWEQKQQVKFKTFRRLEPFYSAGCRSFPWPELYPWNPVYYKQGGHPAEMISRTYIKVKQGLVRLAMTDSSVVESISM